MDGIILGSTKQSKYLGVAFQLAIRYDTHKISEARKKMVITQRALNKDTESLETVQNQAVRMISWLRDMEK